MPEELNIAICEDTKSEQEKLLAMLKELEFPCRCTLFPNAEALLEIYTPGQFDLLFMDIYMDGISGVEAVTRIRETDRTVSVAFLTTSEDFALAGFRLSALGYLVKPYTREALLDILNKARAVTESRPSLVIRRRGQEEHIRLASICYLEIQGRQVAIRLQDGTTAEAYEKLSDLLPQLPPETFFQPHKSYCVNLEQVAGINSELSCFTMANGDNVPIRRLQMTEAKRAFQAHLLRLTQRSSI